MSEPLVSFVVPCYKLGHYLAECVNSILAQTYGNFEIIIMDDCSPDNTSDVAGSFEDDRIRYVRNTVNLGHLRTYNKGIGLTRGSYIWLISADDRLRVPYVLRRYVDFMERYPAVGYVLCATIGLRNSEETGVLQEYLHGDRDRVFNGRRFIARALQMGGGILSPSVMVRRACYETIALFPLDMPHLGDVYLWSRWALQYDVGYLAEPMVNYRLHDSSMMSTFKRDRPDILVRDEIHLLWLIMHESSAAGHAAVASTCRRLLTRAYAQYRIADIYQRLGKRLGEHEYETSLAEMAYDTAERNQIRASTLAAMGDYHYWIGNHGEALGCYVSTLALDPWAAITRMKYGLLRLGHLGVRIRAGVHFLGTTGRRHLIRDIDNALEPGSDLTA